MTIFYFHHFLSRKTSRLSITGKLIKSSYKQKIPESMNVLEKVYKVKRNLLLCTRRRNPLLFQSLPSSISLALTVRIDLLLSAGCSSTSFSYSNFSKYGVLSFLSAIVTITCVVAEREIKTKINIVNELSIRIIPSLILRHHHSWRRVYMYEDLRSSFSTTEQTDLYCSNFDLIWVS